MKKITLSKYNGISKSRKTIERNILDIITDREYSFDECLDFVEESDFDTLIAFLREYNEADINDCEAVIAKYMRA